MNLVDDPRQQDRITAFEKMLRSIVDPEAVNQQALADQATYVEAHGGREAILGQAPIHGTPVPGGKSTRVG